MSFEEPEMLNELDRIDREWETERERYMITSKYGRRYVPSSGAAVVVGLFSVSMGLIWIMSSLALAHDLGALAGVFPLFGIVFVGGGAAISFYQFRKAKRYQAAFRAYQLRRSMAQDRLEE
jgi:apolipoprotein N-acyltransferase